MHNLLSLVFCCVEFNQGVSPIKLERKLCFFLASDVNDAKLYKYQTERLLEEALIELKLVFKSEMINMKWTKLCWIKEDIYFNICIILRTINSLLDIVMELERLASF